MVKGAGSELVVSDVTTRAMFLDNVGASHAKPLGIAFPAASREKHLKPLPQSCWRIESWPISWRHLGLPRTETQKATLGEKVSSIGMIGNEQLRVQLGARASQIPSHSMIIVGGPSIGGEVCGQRSRWTSRRADTAHVSEPGLQAMFR